MLKELIRFFSFDDNFSNPLVCAFGENLAIPKNIAFVVNLASYDIEFIFEFCHHIGRSFSILVFDMNIGEGSVGRIPVRLSFCESASEEFFKIPIGNVVNKRGLGSECLHECMFGELHRELDAGVCTFFGIEFGDGEIAFEKWKDDQFKLPYWEISQKLGRYHDLRFLKGFRRDCL